MSEKFILYSSGIPMAEFYLNNGEITHARRSRFGLNFTEFAPMCKDDDDEYSRFKMRPYRLLSLKQMEEMAVSSSPDSFTISEYSYSRAEWNGMTMYIQRNKKFPCNILLWKGKVIGWICPCREQINLIVREGYEAKTPLCYWENYRKRKLYGICNPFTCMIPMRDGIRLAADIYLPKEAEFPVPAILIRTPYDKDDNADTYFRYIRRGYAVVIQDVRGRNESEGEWIPEHFEIEDGDDTLTWIGNQEWCNGYIGMLGGSYLGYTQWCAAASGNPYLKAMISVVTAGTAFTDGPMPGGCYSSGGFAWNFAMTKRRFAPERMERDDWDDVLNLRPLEEIGKEALGEDIPFVRKILEHPCEDQFWLQGDWVKRSCKKAIPVLIQSGWFDDNGMGTTQALELTKDYPAGMRRVILGPWQHSGNSLYDLHAMSFAANALRFDLDLIYQQWFDHFLKGEENGVEKEAPVEYYTTGENKWKTAEQWPVPDADDTPFYLGENGILFPICAMDGHTGYTYNPENPGTHRIDMSENEIAVPEDYTEEEKRPDYLIYSTPPLPGPLTVTGDATVKLYISSDAPDTDFIVRLCDVDENGRSIKMADGVMAARFRNGFRKAEYMEPGNIYALTIRTSKISHRFAKGHKIRLSITSGAKNLVFPNSNTVKAYNSTETNIAHNSIWHGNANPSSIILHIER